MKTNNTKISVIIPVYNSEKYLKECLESVINQSYQPFEVICIDDGSTDDSLRILKKYAEKNKDVVIKTKEHSNAGDARNIGIDYVTGDYCFFMDSDDVLERDAFGKAVESAEKFKSDMVIFGAYYFFDDHIDEKQIMDWMLNKELLQGVECIDTSNIADRLFDITACNPWNKLIKRDLIVHNSLRFQSVKRANDVYFTALAMGLSHSISFVYECLANYRRHSESLQGTGGKGEEHYKALLALKEGLDRHGLDVKYNRSFCVMALRHCTDNVFYAKGKSLAEKIKSFSEKEKSLEFDKLREEDVDPDLYLRWKCIKAFDNSCEDVSEMVEALKNYQESRRLDNTLISELRHEIDWRVEERKRIKGCFLDYQLYPARKVVIYGAGKIGKKTYKKLSEGGKYTIIGWVDKNYEKLENAEMRIRSPRELVDMEFDKILIAIGDDVIVREVVEELVHNYNISMCKIGRILEWAVD